MSKKPHKVEETTTPYAAKKPAKAAPAPVQANQVRYIDRATARRLTKDILDKHSELFRKLAQ